MTPWREVLDSWEPLPRCVDGPAGCSGPLRGERCLWHWQLWDQRDAESRCASARLSVQQRQ